jgi:hypothetical protein
LPDPSDWVNPTAGNGTYKTATFGSNNNFERQSGSYTWGSYAPDRVFHFDTHGTGGVGVKMTIKAWGNFDTVMYMRTALCGASGPLFDSNDNGCGLASGGSCIEDKLLTPNTDYYVYIDGNGYSKGWFNLQLTFTTLCMDCTCNGGAYGETMSTSEVDCRHAGDFCGNYMNIPYSGSGTYTYYHSNVGAEQPDRNLDDDYDDFKWFGVKTNQYSYTYSTCGFNDADPYGQGNSGYDRQDRNDKIYKFVLKGNQYVMFRVERVGSWSPNNYPRLVIWKGNTCPGTSHVWCFDGYGTNKITWGGGGSGSVSPSDESPSYADHGTAVKSLTAGTYWAIVDVSIGNSSYTQNASTYNFRATFW